MKRLKVKEKLKKSLLVTIALIMVTFMMPIKSRADIINDFIDLILRVPDGVMHIIDKYIGGSEEFTYEQLEFKGGWDEGGRLYNFIVTPYDIFSSGTYEDKNGAYYTKLGLLDINFFADRDIESETIVSSEILAPVIGNVYKGLRNLCMVLMLLVILYIGIKIMISSIAAQQAKYKQLLVDWLVGFALLFIMHYIMSGIVYLNSVVVKMLSNGEGDSYYVGIAELEDDANAFQHDTDSTWFDIAFNLANGQAGLGHGNNFDGEKYQKFKDNRLAVRNSVSETETFSDYIDPDGRIDLMSVPKGKQDSGGFLANSPIYTLNFGFVPTSQPKYWGKDGVIYLSAKIINPGHDNEKYENKAIVRLNAMSYTRTISSFGSEDNDSVILYDNSGTTQVDKESIVVMGYSMLYLGLVIETIMFTFTYIKRVLQMSFLTMIAPVVAIMYPVDKIGDGKAQAFNTWFKDYLFNILVQPMHLLLYTVFFVAASELVSRNIIYALAVYGFMIPAEKYFKKILGFDKASTGAGGPLGGAIGHGLAMDGLGKLAGIGPGGKGGSGGSGESGKKKKVKTKKLKDGDPGVTGPNSSGGPSSGGDSGEPGSGGGSSRTPGAVPKKEFSSIGKGISGAIGHRADRGLKGLTGGKYRHLRELRDSSTGKLSGKKILGAGGAAALNGAKFIGGKALKYGTHAVTRGGSIAFTGALGAVAGAATAMATGDINNLWKGATVGIGAGNKIGKNLGDRAEEFYSDFAEEVKAERAENDPGYKAELRTEQARDAYDEFIESQAPGEREKYEKARDKYAPFMDEVVKGDEDMLKALVALENDPDGEFQTYGNTLENDGSGTYTQVAIAQDASAWGPLRKSQNEKDYMKYLRKATTDGGLGLTAAQAKTRIRLAKLAQSKMGK